MRPWLHATGQFYMCRAYPPPQHRKPGGDGGGTSLDLSLALIQPYSTPSSSSSLRFRFDRKPCAPTMVTLGTDADVTTTDVCLGTSAELSVSGRPHGMTVPVRKGDFC